MAKSVIQEGNECCVCGNPNTEEHHVLFGTANRKLSDKYGYVVRLCPEHHRGNCGVHFDRGLDLHLKRLAQKHFEEHNGTRDDFRRIFGKSYL